MDLERTRDDIDRLNEEEARQLLTDCMDLEPHLTLLLPIGDDRHRVDNVLEHMDRSFSNEWKSVSLHPCATRWIWRSGSLVNGKEMGRTRADPD